MFFRCIFFLIDKKRRTRFTLIMNLVTWYNSFDFNIRLAVFVVDPFLTVQDASILWIIKLLDLSLICRGFKLKRILGMLRAWTRFKTQTPRKIRALLIKNTAMLSRRFKNIDLTRKFEVWWENVQDFLYPTEIFWLLLYRSLLTLQELVICVRCWIVL